MGRLAGKMSLITGGTSGIGYCIAELFAREGATVVIAARNEQRGELAAREIRERTNSDVIFSQCDVSKEDEVGRLTASIMDRCKRVEVLVNNAGKINRQPLESTTEVEWDEVMNANVKSAFLCGKYIIPHMIEAGGGSVINISSTLGLVGRADVPSYSASKGGLIAFTRSLALRYASARVRVNCICPGAVVTEMFRDALEKSGDVEGKRRELEAKHPLGLGTPMDVAYAALYLAADESMWVTGSALVVDGGYTAG